MSLRFQVTGQAFEDVQEQNSRLLKSLREKDDANLNQMTEWMKTTQLARLLKEEKKLLDEQVRLMQAKIEALTRAIQKQEDKVNCPDFAALLSFVLHRRCCCYYLLMMSLKTLRDFIRNLQIWLRWYQQS